MYLGLKVDSVCKVMLISNNSTNIDFKVLYIFQDVWSFFFSNPVKYSRDRELVGLMI